MRRSVLTVTTLVVVAGILAAACATPAPTPTPVPPTPTEAAAPTATPPKAPTPTPKVEKVKLRWFIGLGTGTNPEQQDVQKKVVEEFNASQDEIELVLEVVANEVAFDTLKTEIAGGNPPDIIGPVGIRGTNEFPGIWLPLDKYLKDYDLSDYEPTALDAWKGAEGLIGLPIGVYPSFIYYNKDLFDEAGIPYPPHAFGEKYADGDEWNIEKLEEIALKLTVDANGKDATDPKFNPEKIVQFGFHFQWTDPRGWATMFGAGNFFKEEGGKYVAYVPDHWREAFKWYYDAMWKKYFAPNGPYQQSDLLAAGNPFNSGNVAMAHCHLWYTCCLGDVPNWDIAVVPSYKGKYTAKLHTDMIGVYKDTKYPEQAVKALWYLAHSPDLLEVWGAMPPIKALQDQFFQRLDKKYPGRDWKVAVESLKYIDVPNHEAWMPNFSEADDRVKEFQSLMETTPGLDVDAALKELVSDLQAIFEEAER